jgi:uncharacterized phage protein gp47/JayE
MATKTPAQVAQEFLTQLASLKPDVDTSLTDSDWYVKAQALGGCMAGVYSDQNLLSNDPFPQSARTDALLKHLQTYFTAPFNNFIQPSQASGYIAVTGTVGTVITTSVQGIYPPNGNGYQSLTGFTMAATSALIPMQSISTGAVQNILSGAPMTISNPPAGLNPSAVASGNFQLGRDLETGEEAAARILAFIQTPPEGGTVADYIRWAQLASPLVTNASVLRFANGFGTVGIVITAGTTNIDAAIDAGDAVVITPSQDLINVVQNYIDTVNPITDCATVYGPELLPINVSVTAFWTQGTGATVNPGQPGPQFTQAQLLTNEIMKAIYNTSPGGRQIAGSGFMLKSDIEEQIDNALSDETYLIGSNPIIIERFIANLSATGPNQVVGGLQQPIPGTITIVDGA